MVGDHEGCKGWGGMEHVFPQIWGDGCPLRDMWEEHGKRVPFCSLLCLVDQGTRAPPLA